MSVFEDLQSVAIELDISVKIHVVEGLHWDFVSSPVLDPVGLVLEGKVVFDGASRVSGLFVYARSKGRMESPECQQDGDRGEETKEDACLRSAANFPG